MENIIISIIENKEITFSILFFFMLFYVFWQNDKREKKMEEREERLLENNRELIQHTGKITEYIHKIGQSLTELASILKILKAELNHKLDIIGDLVKDKSSYFRLTSYKLNSFRISQYFELSEFESPDSKEVKLSPKLIELLEKMREEIGKPIIINSGYRTPEYNRKIKGYPESKHMEGIAADIRKIEGLSIDEMAEIAEKVGFDGIGKYDWGIHVDTRGSSARWDYRGKE